MVQLNIGSRPGNIAMQSGNPSKGQLFFINIIQEERLSVEMTFDELLLANFSI